MAFFMTPDLTVLLLKPCPTMPLQAAYNVPQLMALTASTKLTAFSARQHYFLNK